jgi:hypothetical protein
VVKLALRGTERRNKEIIVTVQELIKRLQELPPDAIALVRDQDGELARVDDVDFLYGHWTDGAQRVYIAGSY